MSPSETRLEQAGRSFFVAAQLLGDGHPDFAASRAYFGCFLIACELLASQGMTFKSHHAVIGRFGEVFARPRILDPAFHRSLLRGMQLRQAADYEQHRPDADEVASLIAEGRDFLAAARSYLAEHHRSQRA